MALFRGTNRVCFLQQGEVEIPSDLNGLLMERFEERIDRERIRLTLREWGLPRSFGENSLPPPPAQDPAVGMPLDRGAALKVSLPKTPSAWVAAVAESEHDPGR